MKKRHALSGAQIQTLVGSLARCQALRLAAERQPLLLIAAAAVSGVLLDAALAVPGLGDAAVAGFWLSLFGTVILAILISPHHVVRRSATVLLALPMAGWFHFHSGANYRSATILAHLHETAQPTVVEARIDRPAILRRHPLADQPGRRDQSPWQTQVDVTLRRIRVGRRFEPCSGRASVVVDGRTDDLKPGDVIRIYGRIRRPQAPTNPGQRDLRVVYRRRGLHAHVDVATPDQIVSVENQPMTRWRASRAVAAIASVGRDLLLRHTSESVGPLAVALVIGRRDFVDGATRDQLLVTGTAHLLSVSGLHLAIVVLLATWLAALLRMRPSVKIVWILLVCVLYTAITGGRPPVMRAAILVGTFALAIWMRRSSQPINTLALAALILVFINPTFVFSVGVQLSFLAVATLLACSARGVADSAATAEALAREEQLESLVHHSRSPGSRHARTAFRVTRQLTWFSACVTAISCPLVWYHFHVVSPISIVCNVLLSPFLFLALASGIATVLMGLMVDSLAIIPGAICNFTLRAIQWIIETAAGVPGGHFWLPSPPMWWVVTFYVVIAATLLVRSSRVVSRIRYGWIGAWMLGALLMATSKSPLSKGTLEATFVDVGHGTCVVIRHSPDDVWLYDCGHMGNPSGSSRGIDATLWSMGVTRLRGVYLSHADADHFNSLPGLLDRFAVGEVITPPGMLVEPEPALKPIRDSIREAAVTSRQLSRSAVMARGNHTTVILHPPAERLAGSDNANSLVLQITVGGKTLVLPGDLERPGTEALLNQPRPPPGGVLMAPHHGSLTMDASAVLQWARPSETVVSGGQRARDPRVREMLAVTGSGVHVTSEVGAIRVQIDHSGSLRVRSWSLDPW